MFICEPCLERSYTNFGFAMSYGTCEICDRTKPCCDISSSRLIPKPPSKEELEQEIQVLESKMEELKQELKTRFGNGEFDGDMINKANQLHGSVNILASKYNLFKTLYGQ